MKLDRAINDICVWLEKETKSYLKDHPEGDDEASQLYLDLTKQLAGRSKFACLKATCIVITNLLINMRKVQHEVSRGDKDGVRDGKQESGSVDRQCEGSIEVPKEAVSG